MLGVAAYIPANLWPMLQTRVFLQTSEDTIIGGAVKVAQHGDWAIASVILAASVAIPLTKFAAVAALATGPALPLPARIRFRLLWIVELIGRWSMVDVFVVAVLASLVRLNIIATVTPGPAAAAFALSVIFTMLAAQSVDSRLIWDNGEYPA